MVKGCEKRVIFVKLSAKGLFSEAYLILRDEPAEMQGRDLLQEAERIVAEQTQGAPKTEKRKRRILPFLLSFLLGMLCALGAGALCCHWIF